MASFGTEQKILGKSAFQGLQPFVGPGLNAGLTTLLAILNQQGKTDPRAFNLQLADLSRGTQSELDTVHGSLAASGLTGSMAGKGLEAAVRAGGENRRAGMMAQEAQKAEAQKRSDLDMMLQLLINPAMGASGQANQAQAQKDAQQAALQNALIGAAMSAASMGIAGGK